MSVIQDVHKYNEDLVRALKKHLGIRKFVEDLYPDKAHFIYELLQNAEDQGASAVGFMLEPGRLKFEHNGKSFSPQDIYAITDIGNSNKENDDDKIGRFGAGFKAVFAYSETPHIWSPTFSFRINDLVLPTEIPSIPDINGQTRFEFPFDSPKITAADAFQDVRAGLEDLAETTLLFLRHIESISWTIEGAGSGEILRVAHAGGHVEILKSLGSGGTTSLHFLKFDRPVDGLPKQNVAVAFPLDFLPNNARFSANKPLCDQLKIVPAPSSQVAVFFPAKKETSGLRFHLHAPFVPELSRASIKETPANAPLFAQLASLAASSLHAVRDLGLLTTEFLGVLPNPQDQLGKPYEGIRDAIVHAMDEEALTPTYAKTHAPAKLLYQARVALKELLSLDDIEFLIDYEDDPPQWAANRALQGTNAERFMNGLSIRNWDIDAFVRHIDQSASEVVWRGSDSGFMAWLDGKSVDWHQQFYALLEREAEAKSRLHSLQRCKIIRLGDGSYSTGPTCHFPDGRGSKVAGLRCVDQRVYEAGKSKAQQESARRFLESVGVTAVGERQLVEVILKGYGQEQKTLNEREYLSHMRRFIKLLNEDASCLQVLSNSALFVGSDGKWHKASEIYLDAPYLDTGLAEWFDTIQTTRSKVPLADFYLALPIDTSKIALFAEKLGAQTRMVVARTSCNNNPNFGYLCAVSGERYTSPINRDYVIERFHLLAGQKSERLARLVWNTMCALPLAVYASVSGENILRAVFRKSERGGARVADSQLVHQLRAEAWVPQMGEFVRPAQARRDLLPEGFPFDAGWPWIKAIRFGHGIEIANAKAQAEAIAATERRQAESAAAKTLGFHDAETARKLAEIPADDALRMHAEWERRRAVELPEHVPGNASRRSDRVIAYAGDAPLRRSEKRTRSVSVGREEVKVETDQYLRQQYTNADAIQICQICKDVLPFKLDNGEHFFEAVILLPEMRKHHHQNYLCLCPNHSAMFRHANGSRATMRQSIRTQTENQLPVVLAQCDETIYFTKAHLADLQAILESDEGDEVISADKELSAAN